jgi:hypothetical protein
VQRIPRSLFSRIATHAGAFVILCVFPCGVAAQDEPQGHQHVTTTPAPRSWTWATDANVFGSFNYQLRRYTDFAAWESQNWFMATAERPVGEGRLTVHGMLSLEWLTLGRYVYAVRGPRFRAGGSPQVFQTGESFDGNPLVDYQHPHDLLMGLGATYQLPRRGLTYILGADLVGTPTLGPAPFMHRASARNNPQVPLAHHHLDSTHSTTGVVRAGVEVSGWTFETSAFRGEEPDEERYDIEQPRLNSWAARVGWRRGPWHAQVSGGSLHEPEWYAPFDQTRFTASVGFTGAVGSRALAATAAWGQTREYAPSRAVADAALLEWDLQVTNVLATYGRAELARKEMFPHAHVPGFAHPHFFSNIGALTLGAVHDLSFFGFDRLGRFGIGGDVTVYRIPSDLQLLYGGSRSFHAFLRWRPRGATVEHVH